MNLSVSKRINRLFHDVSTHSIAHDWQSLLNTDREIRKLLLELQVSQSLDVAITRQLAKLKNAHSLALKMVDSSKNELGNKLGAQTNHIDRARAYAHVVNLDSERRKRMPANERPV